MRSLIPTLRGPVQRRRTEPGIGRTTPPAGPGRSAAGQNGVRETVQHAPDGMSHSPQAEPGATAVEHGPRMTDLAAAWEEEANAGPPPAADDREAPGPSRAATGQRAPRPKPSAGEGKNAATASPVAARRPAGKGGPGPSKLDYRLRRAWAKPGLRNAVLVYLPLALLGLAGWRLAADDGVRAWVDAHVANLADRLAERPEFAVHSVRIFGASPGLAAAVRETVALAPGTSSLRLDLETIRHSVEALGAVRTARVRLDPQGVLEVAVTERVARALWRNEVGGLVLLDGEGVIIGLAAHRTERPDLPLVLGEGARPRVDEALELMAAAPDLRPRIRALVRVGERRWDVVLERTVIMLPGAEPAKALARVMALHRGEALLDRDLAAIDMRLPNRPTLRLAPGAVEAYRLHKVTVAEAGEET